jgi:DNA polymerase-1
MAAMQPKTLDLTTKLVTDADELESLLKDLKPEDIVAFDTETTGLDHTKDHIVGFSFALSEEVAYYVPVAHFYLGVPDQVSKEAAQKALRKIFTSKVIGHNIKFDLHFVADYLGVETLGIYGDSIVLAWLVNPESKLSLDHLANVWLEHTMIAFKDTVKKGETFASVELEDATKYAAEDALITLKLYNMLLEKLKLQSAEHLIALAHDLEFPFITTLMEMERNGIASDAKSLESFKEEAKTKLAELTKNIYAEAGGEFNINSPKQLGDILFDKLELPFGKKRSTDIKVLNSLLGQHPIIEYIMQYREMFKLYSTYIEPLLELNKQSEDGRIHTSFVQTGTATGRLSSKNPNLQNIPTRSELGARIRGAFVAPEGKLLIGIDYSQIELRLLAHFSQDSVLVSAFNDDKDIHMQTAIVLFGEEEAASKRSVAKTVNFGLLYGMGPKKLSDTLGITTKEAKSIIEKYFESFPTVKQYFASIVELSKEEGYVETLLKRRRYFDYASAVPMMKAAYERESVNTVFQGSAADLIKMSMNKIASVIKTRQLPVKMMLQIHDELIFEVNEGDAEAIAREFKEVMESIYTLRIPLKTSVNIGKHWGELK